jgi:hypothetical protein
MDRSLEWAGELAAECPDLEILLTDGQGRKTVDPATFENVDIGFRGQRVACSHTSKNLLIQYSCQVHSAQLCSQQCARGNWSGYVDRHSE